MGLFTAARYEERAFEYTTLFGTMQSVHPCDVQLVRTWADQSAGPLLDAGCGPGQWTAYLAQLGYKVEGMDQVEGFIEHANGAYPDVRFRVGNIDASPFEANSLAGVLAWYSLIHHAPDTIGQPLSEFARTLRPGGLLLTGFFTGPELVAFDHAVTTAYLWPPEALAAELEAAGFKVLEIHTRSTPGPGPRPHGAILAKRIEAD